MSFFGKTPATAKPKVSSISRLPIQEVLKLRMGEQGFFLVTQDKGPSIPFMIERSKDHQFQDIIRIAPETEGGQVFAFVMQTLPLPIPVNAISFNICSILDGNYFPGVYGAEFIKWGYKLYEKKLGKIDIILGHWLDLPNSINFQQYKSGLKIHHGNRFNAAMSTWSGHQFAKNGHAIPIMVAEKSTKDIQAQFGLEGEPNQVMTYWVKQGFVGLAPTFFTSPWGDEASK